MMAYLNGRKLLFKAKTQSANSNDGYEGYERHDTEVDGRQMHNEEAKNVDLVREHLQIKKKNQNVSEKVRAGSKNRKGEEPDYF
jgi:hypothetical protein